MSWSFTASGHVDSAAAEKAIARKLRDAIAELPAEHVSVTSFYGQHTTGGDIRTLGLDEPGDDDLVVTEPGADPQPATETGTTEADLEQARNADTGENGGTNNP